MHEPILNKVILPLENAKVVYFPEFLSVIEANSFFELLKSNIAWQQEEVKVFGKLYPQPRLTALYANNNRKYSYSGLTLEPKPFTPSLIKLKQRIEEISNTNFTSCLLNLYRNGKDSNGWHADDEKELGRNPVIASVSLGQERIFHFKHKTKKELKYKLLLENGSLLLMEGETQHNWYHQIPKTRKIINERINLTFRIIP
jgi:alkylated DNA repair dioxygenase AlkB